MKHFLLALSFLYALTASAQTTPTPSGSPNTLSQVRGGLIAGDSLSQVAPRKDTSAWFGRKSDFIRLPGSNRLFFFDGQWYREIVGAFDSTGLYNSILQRVKYTDTAGMLVPYANGLAQRVKYSDTAAMLAAYQAAIGSRVKYSDTAGMLFPLWTSIALKANDAAVVHIAGTETITGTKTFNSAKFPNTPVANDDPVNLGYAAATYAPLSQKGAINGIATLGPNGKIPNGQIPAIAITETFVVNSQAAMLALSAAEQGDVAVRTDLNKSFILINNAPATLGSWQELLSPTVANSDQVPEGSTNLYFTVARARQAISGGTGIGYNSSTGVVTNTSPNLQSNLSLGTATGTTQPINNSDGTGVTLPAVTGSTAGLMPSVDKTKLDGIAAGAEVNVNPDWNAVSGDALILNKPATFPPSAHTHTFGQVPGLQDTFNTRIRYTDTVALVATKKNLRDTAAQIRTSMAAYEPTANKATNFNTINNTLFPTLSAIANKFSNGSNIAGQLKFLNNPDQYDLSPANMDWMWHDQFAFGRNLVLWETTTDFGGNWATGTANLGIFNQKQSDAPSVTLLTNTTGVLNGLRIKWSGFGFGQLNWIITQLNYTGTTCAFNMIVEESSDNVNFTTLATYTGLQQAGATTAAWRTPQATAFYTRVTFVINNGLSPAGATATLKNLRGMALRAGDQGGGKEFELPFNWTNEKYIRITSPTYTPASGSATLPSNYTVILSNSTNNGELTKTTLANLLQGQGFAMADSSVWQTKYRSDTARVNAYAAIALKASDISVVHIAGAETITGSKTFSSSPLIPSGATSTAAVNKSQLDVVASMASDSTLWQTKYRSDTGRANVYNALAQKLNLNNGANYTTINGDSWSWYAIDNIGVGVTLINPGMYFYLKTVATSGFAKVSTNLLTADRIFRFPNDSGTLALAHQVAPATGSGSYIQNQFTGAQTADAWISGMFKASQFIGPNGSRLYPESDHWKMMWNDGTPGHFKCGGLSVSDDWDNPPSDYGLYVKERALVGGGWPMADNGQTIFSVQAPGSGNNAMTLGSPSGTLLGLQNHAGQFGLFFGMNTGTGNQWIQAGRVDGTATAYNLSLQASGGNVGIGTSSPTERLQVGGNAKIDGNITADNLSSGTYTPTVTGSGTFTPAGFTYMRVGDIVSVTGRISCSGLGAIPNTISITLPVASNIAANTDIIGVVSGNALAASPNFINADSSLDQALVNFITSGGSSCVVYLHFQYIIQ